MKLQIVNDLHNNWKYKDMGADALLIAGDFGNGLGELFRLMDKITNIPVFFVLGNHDYYHEVTQDVAGIIRAKCPDNWHFLDNDIVIHEGVRFVGTTLWTDCGGPEEQWFVKQNIKTWPDFQFTLMRDEKGDLRRKIVEDLYPQYEEAVKFLTYAIKEPFDGKTVIMTHFVPTRKATHPRFAGQIANHYFATDLEHLMGKDMLWCMGHTHNKYDFMIGDTRLVCNPVGYGKEGTGYTGDLIIEV